MEAVSVSKQTLLRVVATEEITDNIIATRHYEAYPGDLCEILGI